MPKVAKPVDQRIINGSRAVDGCWIWQQAKHPTGYGLIRVRVGKKKITKRAHRIAYAAFIGAIPDGLDLDHLCRNRACVNPWHLEPVTRSTNLKRGLVGQEIADVQRAKTHCRRGHPYAGTNLYKDKTGRRHCRSCSRERQYQKDRSLGKSMRKRRFVDKENN